METQNIYICPYCGMSWSKAILSKMAPVTPPFGCPFCGNQNIQTEPAFPAATTPDRASGQAWASTLGPNPVSLPEQNFVGYKEGKAVRSARKPRYDKIPLEGLQRLAGRYEMGMKYPNDGDNWKEGGKDFWTDAANHAEEHLALYTRGDRSDDHLAAVAWYCFSRMWWEAQPRDKEVFDCQEKQAAQRQER